MVHILKNNTILKQICKREFDDRTRFASPNSISHVKNICLTTHPLKALMNGEK